MIFEEPLLGLAVEGYNFDVIFAITIVYGVLTLCGLIIVTLFIAVLIRARSLFREFPFFTIVWQLTIASALNLLAQATCIVPCAILDAREGYLKTWYDVGMYIVDFTDIAATFFVFLMALNRLAVFVVKPLAKAFTNDVYKKLELRDGERSLYRLAKNRHRQSEDIEKSFGINDENGHLLTERKKALKQWCDYFEGISAEELPHPAVPSMAPFHGSIHKITVEENDSALRTMRPGKATGPLPACLAS
ncbi:unnamed protein product [Heligmosomoides polygyrus]|uniref:G_PROTEIN_RECEP_F1_2 domain-containing protein n=1 Tax=Heligmosomoides polygyrus TaxID=6339 RepID=A0A183FK89_HELPZ|nr:unnamed protein product [Heligmosomoides polygyrus]